MAKKSNKTEQDQKKNSRKAAKMCTLVVAAFAITWTPFHTDRLYYLVWTKQNSGEHLVCTSTCSGSCEYLHQSNHLWIHVETDERHSDASM